MAPNHQSKPQPIKAKPKATKATQQVTMEAQKQPEYQTTTEKLILIVDDWMDHDNPNMMHKAGESVRSAESLTVLYIVEPCTVNLGVRTIPQLEEAKVKKILGALFNGPDPLVCRPDRKPRRQIKDLCGQIPLYILLRADFEHKEWIEEILNMPGLVSDLERKLKGESVFEDDPVFRRLLNNKRVHHEEIKDKFRQLLRWCYPRPNGDLSQSRLVAKLLALDYIEDLISQHNYNSKRIKFRIDTCFDKGETTSPLGRAVDHPSYLINRSRVEVAKYVKIINRKSKDEEKASRKKLGLFKEWRKPGAPSNVDAAQEIDKLIEDEETAKLSAEKDKAGRVMRLLKGALKRQQRKLAKLLNVPSDTEFVSDLQMDDLAEAIKNAPETKMFCGTSLTIAAEIQKLGEGYADKVTLFQQGGTMDVAKNILGNAFNFELNLEAAKFVFKVQIGSYNVQPGEREPARFVIIYLGSTDLGQDIMFEPEALWGSSKLQKRWTIAYGVGKFRRDPFAVLEMPELPPLSEKEKEGMISADAVAWLAANSESLNGDIRRISPKTMIMMQSGAIIFSLERYQSKSKKDGYYPIPDGRIEMLMPKAKGKKVTLSVQQVKGYMEETKVWMNSGKSGWACSTHAATSHKATQAPTAGGSLPEQGVGRVSRGDRSRSRHSKTDRRPSDSLPGHSDSTRSLKSRLENTETSAAPDRGRSKDRRSSSATGCPRADSETSAQPRREGTPSHTAKTSSRPQSPASPHRQRQQSPAKGGKPRGGTNQDQRDP